MHQALLTQQSLMELERICREEGQEASKACGIRLKTTGRSGKGALTLYGVKWSKKSTLKRSENLLTTLRI